MQNLRAKAKLPKNYSQPTLMSGVTARMEVEVKLKIEGKQCQSPASSAFRKLRSSRKFLNETR